MSTTRTLTNRTVTLLHRVALCAVLLAFCPPDGWAQVALPGVTGAADSASVPADPYGRETPRGLVVGLVAAFASGDAERVTHFLEAPVGATTAESSRLALRLQRKLDTSGSLQPFAALSNEPEGEKDDGLPLNEERIGTIRTQEGDLPLIARRTAALGGAAHWAISAASLKSIATEKLPLVAANPSDHWLPTTLYNLRFAGAPAADWLILLALAGGSFLGMRLVFSGLLRLLRVLVRKPDTHRGFQFAEAALPPLGLYLAVVALFVGTQQLHVAIVARQVLARYAGIVAWVAFVWFLWRLIDMLSDLWSDSMARADRRRALSALVFFRRSAKALLVVVAFVAVLDTIGIDVTTGIAALGLGGLAIALGAQKTIENLVGSLAVIIDQPVRVGDFCKVGEVTGTVEDIGMRSTQLRTNARTVVTIPNGDFSSKKIENYSRRDRFLFDPTIGLTYDTTAAKMRSILEAIRKLLHDSPNIIDDGRARFANFNASSLDIEIFAYIKAADYVEFLAYREEILLDIMETVSKEGLSMAFPTQTIVMKNQTET